MTEVAQVAAVVAHDNMDNITNEDEHTVSDEENHEDDKTHEEDDVNEDDAAEEKSDMKSNTKERNETEKTEMNGVKHEENNNEKDGGSEAVNGIEKDADEKQKEQPDTSEDQNISDVAMKKEVSDKFKVISDERTWMLPFIEIINLCCIEIMYLLSHWTTETLPIQKAGGKKLRAKAKQRQRGCDEQIWGHAEGQGGAQQAEE